MMGTPGWFFNSSCPYQPASPPAQAKGMGQQPLAPVEPGSTSLGTSAEQPPDLGMCQAFPSPAVAWPEHPSPAGRSTTTTTSVGAGKAGGQLAAGGLLPAGAAVGLIQLGLPYLAPQAAWCRRWWREGWSQAGPVVSSRGLPLWQPSPGIRQHKAASRNGLGSLLQVLPAPRPASIQLPPPLGMSSFCPPCLQGMQWVLPQVVALLGQLQPHRPQLHMSPL